MKESTTPLVRLEQLQDGKHDVVDVAKPRSFCLFGMVCPSSPIHSYVRLSLVQEGCSADGAPSVNLTQISLN